MPYKIRKIRNKDCYSVKNSISGKIHSKCATLKNAKAQKRLLDSLESRGGSVRRSPRGSAASGSQIRAELANLRFARNSVPLERVKLARNSVPLRSAKQVVPILYKIRKIRNKDCYYVKNSISGKIHSKCTSLKNAKAQKLLLESLTPKKRK